MPCVVRYLTHPQVTLDPSTPVPSWSLSELGRTRAEALAKSGKLSRTLLLVSSAERKAIQTANIIAAKLSLDVKVRSAMHENDRSSTGFLPPHEFEQIADQFFAKPLISVRGWERAIDAQHRIVREVEYVLNHHSSGDVTLIGHGAVGTLLFCHYARVAIDRSYDQPAGGGHCFSFAKDDRRILHHWRRFEDL